MESKITIILDNENAQINLEGKIKIKDGAIVLGKALGMLVKGYDETVVVKAAEVFAHALEEQYLEGCVDGHKNED